MACNNPRYAWRSRDRNPETGKYPLVFNEYGKDCDRPDAIEVPCYNYCMGCKITRANDWAVKAHCEMRYQGEQNCFMLNLSYSDKHLPKGRTLCERDVQLFLKRLRKHYSERKIRYLYCGEYGTRKGRPHYHMIIFGMRIYWEFCEFHHYSKGNRDYPMYVHHYIEKLWGKGETFVGRATYQSARYIAKYTTKAVYGPESEDVYRNKERPFIRASQSPALGIPFLERWTSDVYPSDHVVIDGKEHKPPKSFDNWLKKHGDETLCHKVFHRRKRAGWKRRKEAPLEYTPQRRETKESCLRERSEHNPRD